MKIPTFKNQNLYKQVFTHRSYLNEREENLESNERLEFLGDSILSFAVSIFIFENYKDFEEGKLTNLRATLTNTETLYRLAESIDLGKYLMLSKGEEESGGRKNKTILADALEALIGGIYLDQGIEATEKFIYDLLLSKIMEIAKLDNLKDAKSKLQEITQQNFKIAPTYKVITTQGPDHSKIYTVGAYLGRKFLAQGTGRSKQDAEKQAAQAAIQKVISLTGKKKTVKL